MTFQPENRSHNMSSQMESKLLSRRQLIRDVCAVTGWVFAHDLLIAASPNQTIFGDTTNPGSEWGTIRGRILFDGDPPPIKEIELEKAGLSPSDLEWFSSTGPIINQEWIVDPNSKAIQWVYVWLIPESGKLAIHESLQTIPEADLLKVVDQEPAGYVPHCIGLREGQGLLMRNQGPVGHVFNFPGFSNPSFNRSMAPNSEIKVENLKMEPAAVQINCPPHPWERLWLRMFDSPYFAVTQADGSFEIKLAPTGPCRLVIWHEKAGFLGGKKGKSGSPIQVTGNAITDVGDFRLKPKS